MRINTGDSLGEDTLGRTATRRAGVCAALLIVAATGLSPGSPSAMAQDIVIGAGQGAGLFGQLGRALCRTVQGGPDPIACTLLPTEAGDTTESIANLINVGGGAIEFGLATSDGQFHAVNKSGPFEFMDAGVTNLRSVLGLVGTPFTVIARRDAEIGGFDDLRGKRVNVGNPGSAQRVMMDMVMSAAAWTSDDFALIQELPTAEQSLALCHDRVEAVVTILPHPNLAVQKLIELCDATIVDVSGPQTDKLLESNPYLARVTIPAGLYTGLESDVRSFGPWVTLVTSADIDDETVRVFVETVLARLDRLRKLHPSLRDLDAAAMARTGLTAPLHEGAKQAFQAQGLM